MRRSISRRSLSLMSSCTESDDDLMESLNALALRFSGSNITSPMKSRMPMVGLCPIADKMPVAKTRNVNRLERVSMTKRSVAFSTASSAAVETSAMQPSHEPHQLHWCDICGTMQFRPVSRLHCSQLEIPLNVRYCGLRQVAHSELGHVTTDNRVGYNQSRSKYDH